MLELELFKRKSCVMAIPMDAKAKDVLNHARNVRSTIHDDIVNTQRQGKRGK